MPGYFKKNSTYHDLIKGGKGEEAELTEYYTSGTVFPGAVIVTEVQMHSPNSHAHQVAVCTET